MKRVISLAILACLLVGILVLVLNPGHLPRVQAVQAQTTCTNAAFRGPYGYTFDGLVNTGTSPELFAATGRLVADGQGNLSGAETASLNGDIFPRNYTGTYKVNSDCTGSATTIDSSGVTTSCDFVIVAGGREVQVIEADAGTVIVGCLKQQ